MPGKGYTKKDLVPIRYKLIISRNELIGILNVIKVSAEEGNIDYLGLIGLVDDIIKKYKVD